MRTIVKLTLPVLASLTLVACGSSGGSSSSTQAASTTTAGVQTTASSASAAVVKTAAIPALHATALVDSQGLTLYHLTGESAGRFICTSSACVQVWHPVTVTTAQTPSGTVAALSTVKRPDGTEQVAYKGEPLYTFVGDKQPGEDKGQGLKDVGTWTVVQTSGEAQGESQPAPAVSGSGSSEGSSESSGGGRYGY